MNANELIEQLQSLPSEFLRLSVLVGVFIDALANAWHMRDDIVELASHRDVWLNIPDIDFVSRLRKLGVVVS